VPRAESKNNLSQSFSCHWENGNHRYAMRGPICACSPFSDFPLRIFRVVSNFEFRVCTTLNLRKHSMTLTSQPSA
jgi:hypothetical protein